MKRRIVCLGLVAVAVLGGCAKGRMFYVKSEVELAFDEAVQAWIQAEEKLDELEWRKGSGVPILVTAAEEGFVDAVEMLLLHGASPNVTSPLLGETPLHAAIKLCDPKFENCKLISKKSLKIMQLLLDHKAKVDALDSKGKTPLHWAAEANRIDCCDFLIKHQAKLDIKDKDGFTPLAKAEALHDPKLKLNYDKLIFDLKKHMGIHTAAKMIQSTQDQDKAVGKSVAKPAPAKKK